EPEGERGSRPVMSTREAQANLVTVIRARYRELGSQPGVVFRGVTDFRRDHCMLGIDNSQDHDS
ncbi:MAG: hypothetical protein WBZ27_26050, partial [Pseudolabrys sp.]